jgi:hypothetical protein
LYILLAGFQRVGPNEAKASKRSRKKGEDPGDLRRAAGFPSYDEINYEGALARSVLDHKAPLESEDAIALAAALSSLTTR